MAATRLRFEQKEKEEDAGHCGYCHGGWRSVRRERFAVCLRRSVVVGTV